MEATIDPQLLDEFTRLVPPARQPVVETAVTRLRALRTHDASLADFLKEFAVSVADLYATTSVAIWFKLDGGVGELQRRVAIGWENFLLDDETSRVHLDLLESSIRHGKPQAFLPYSLPQDVHTKSVSDGVGNPTDSYLLLAPIRFENRGTAVLELALGPKPLRQPHELLLRAYLDWLAWLSDILEKGIQRCFDHTDRNMVNALAVVQQTSQEVEAIQDQIRTHIQNSLRQLAGQNFGSLSANQAVAKQVHSLLDGKGLRVQCPECGSAAILRCQNAGNSKTGAFMFDHYLESGRTFHGGQTTFPDLTIVVKPPRRKKK